MKNLTFFSTQLQKLFFFSRLRRDFPSQKVHINHSSPSVLSDLHYPTCSQSSLLVPCFRFRIKSTETGSTPSFEPNHLQSLITGSSLTSTGRESPVSDHEIRISHLSNHFVVRRRSSLMLISLSDSFREYYHVVSGSRKLNY